MATYEGTDEQYKGQEYKAEDTDPRGGTWGYLHPSGRAAFQCSKCGEIVLEMWDPTDHDDPAIITTHECPTTLPPEPSDDEIEDAIAVYYSTDQSLEESLSELERSTIFDQPDLASDKLALLADSDSIISFVDEIIYYALRERATDIHIEPQESLARVRFRVDGNLREMATYSRKLHRAFLSRLKIISNLNISESRFPQDGRFSMTIGSQTANFRFSCIPTQWGEKAVIRILALTGKKTMLTLDKMMMSQNVLQPLKRLIQKGLSKRIKNEKTKVYP